MNDTVGGCYWAYLSRYSQYHHSHTTSEAVKSLPYLLDLEREGHVTGWLYSSIGDAYKYRESGDSSMAMTYYQKGIDHGYIYAHVKRSQLVMGDGGDTSDDGYTSDVGDTTNVGDTTDDGDRSDVADTADNTDITDDIDAADDAKDEVVLSILEAEAKGQLMKDDRVLHELINILNDEMIDYTPKPHILGKFAHEKEMALHYCDVLIERKSPLGYIGKAEVYNGSGSQWYEEDETRAITILEDAVRAGLADTDTCRRLQARYGYVLSLFL